MGEVAQRCSGTVAATTRSTDRNNGVGRYTERVTAAVGRRSSVCHEECLACSAGDMRKATLVRVMSFDRCEVISGWGQTSRLLGPHPEWTQTRSRFMTVVA